jgi:hypothetical protein
VRARLGPRLPAVAQARAGRPDELVGFPFGQGLRREIAAVEAEQLTDVGNVRVALVESDPDPARDRFVARLAERGARPERRPTAVRGRWQEPDDIEELFLPADALRVVTEALEVRP